MTRLQNKAGSTLNTLSKTAGRVLCLLLLAMQLALFSSALGIETSYAEVLKADIVAGQTVEQRDLSISECPSIDSQYAALVTSDGEVYFNRKGSERTQIASITKVMTAIVALDNADPSLEVSVSERAAEIGESSANLQAGDKMSLESALKALLVPSGNDAAVAIAETVGAIILEGNPSLAEDALGAFVSCMNEKASELNLEDTVYENPHGLDDREFEGELHSTALDQAKVARCAMGYSQIRDIVGGGDTSIRVTRNGTPESVELESTDLLLDSYEYAIGIKTGVTNLAGPSFMGAASKDGLELYAVVLDSTDEYTRFEDAKELFEWGYEHIVDLPLAQSAEYATMRLNGASGDVPVIAEAPHYEWMNRTVKATLENPDASVQVFDLEGNVSQEVAFDELHGTVEVGDKVGTISFYQHNQKIAEENLVACERLDAPNPIDTIIIWWQRFTQGLDGEKGRAASKVYNTMPVIKDNTTNAA